QRADALAARADLLGRHRGDAKDPETPGPAHRANDLRRGSAGHAAENDRMADTEPVGQSCLDHRKCVIPNRPIFARSSKGRHSMRKELARSFTLAIVSALVAVAAGGGPSRVSAANDGFNGVPLISDWVFVTAGDTPPSQAPWLDVA